MFTYSFITTLSIHFILLNKLVGSGVNIPVFKHSVYVNVIHLLSVGIFFENQPR